MLGNKPGGTAAPDSRAGWKAVWPQPLQEPHAELKQQCFQSSEPWGPGSQVPRFRSLIGHLIASPTARFPAGAEFDCIHLPRVSSEIELKKKSTEVGNVAVLRND